MSIAGGDPLVHPQIVEIVKMVSEGGWKPIINTNGLALGRKLLKRLKEAGVFGFTFHVDSGQGRGGRWDGMNELELNELRLHFARMVADAGGLTTSFNSTVFPHTLKHVPKLLEWAREHIDIVHLHSCPVEVLEHNGVLDALDAARDATDRKSVV